MRRILGVLLLISLLVAACGDEGTGGVSDGSGDVPDDVPIVSDTLPTDDSGDAGDTVMAPLGPTMTVGGLLVAGSGGPYSVMGYLFVLTDGGIVLSDAIAESYPPQPAGAQVTVEGVNLQTVPLVEPADPALAQVRWTETPIELVGSLDGGVFYGSTPASS